MSATRFHLTSAMAGIVLTVIAAGIIAFGFFIVWIADKLTHLVR